MLTYAESLRDYNKLYDWRNFHKVDPTDASDLNQKAAFKFVLHCYNKYQSSIPKEKNIPFFWSRYFTSEDAKAFKPFGDFGDYHGTGMTAKEIYDDQIRKIEEIRTDCSVPSSLIDEAIKICKARAEEKIIEISDQTIQDCISAIVGNGTLGIFNEMITCDMLEEKFADNPKYKFIRAPGEYEKEGIDGLIVNRETGAIHPKGRISVKCSHAFNMKTFRYFLDQGKDVDVFIGVLNKDNDEYEVVHAGEVPDWDDLNAGNYKKFRY